MNQQKDNTSKVVLAVAIIFILTGIFVIVWGFFGPNATIGKKNIRLSVVDDSGKTTVYEMMTEATVLKEVMDELADKGFTYDGVEDQFGIMIHTINGVRATYEQDDAYWAFYLNDEYCQYGISTQPVNDGDQFSIVYTLASDE